MSKYSPLQRFTATAATAGIAAKVHARAAIIIIIILNPRLAPAAVPAQASSSTASTPALSIVRKTIACFEQGEIPHHNNQLRYVTFRIHYTPISTFCITETIIPYSVADEICGICVDGFAAAVAVSG